MVLFPWSTQTVNDVIYEILATEGFIPLLQSAAFLAVRLHAVSSEVSTTLTRASFLLTSAEDTFCEAAQEMVQVGSCATISQLLRVYLPSFSAVTQSMGVHVLRCAFGCSVCEP